MVRKLLQLSFAIFIGVWSQALIAGEEEYDSLKQEIRDIKHLVNELSERIERLERRIAVRRSITNPSGPSDVDLMWKLFGMRLEETELDEFRQAASRYRGGMHVVAIRPESSAARQGIHKGDILVGIHVWETLNRDNVDFILASDVIRQNKGVKFYIIRKEETLFGYIKAR